MENENLIAAVSILIVLSGAAERLVEVIKGFIPRLNIALDNPAAEARRKGWVQLLTIICCLVTAILAREQISGALIGSNAPVSWTLVGGFGVLAAGGSSLWNSILTYLVGAKDIKKAEATEKKAAVEQHKSQTSDFMPSISMLPVGSSTSTI